MKVYYDKDLTKDLVKEKKVTIVGYGSQGHAHALNLKESGANVTIALKSGSSSKARAEKDGFKVMEPKEAVKDSDVVMILIPDELQKDFYQEIKNDIKQGATIAFAHGLSIHFKLIEPREDLSVIMVAPKGPGHTVRGEYVKGGGVPTLISVHVDKTGESKELALSYATAIGAGKSGMIETTFKNECETDLFGEQAVLCGGLTGLIKAGFETLVEAGYPAEMAYFECLHEMKLIVDLIYEDGIANMHHSISNTAEYGDYTAGERLVTKETKAEMKKILNEIQDGTFVNNWMKECENGLPYLNKKREETRAHEIEKVGKDLRAMMPWIAKNKLVKDRD